MRGCSGSAGAIVSTASSVREALDLIAQDAPDFAILDVNLGTENSFPVARALRELGTPFVFATGHGEVAAAPAELSRAPLLTKPFKGPQLLELARQGPRPRVKPATRRDKPRIADLGNSSSSAHRFGQPRRDQQADRRAQDQMHVFWDALDRQSRQFGARRRRAPCPDRPASRSRPRRR